MTNYEIARRFEAIANILEIQGENAFKVRAYRTAVEVIDDLDDDLAAIQMRGELRTLPGFGDAIASKTTDFLTTGTTALWERIKDTVPPGVVQMAAVPGVGPRTAKTLWDALGLTSVDALEAACQAQQVRAVTGFGAAKEAALLEKLAAWRRLTEKLPRRWALPLAERLASTLRKCPGVEHVELAGELRMGKEAVTEIVLVVVCDPLQRLAVEQTAATLTPLVPVPVELGFATAEGRGYTQLAYTSTEALYHALDLESHSIAATAECVASEAAVFTALGLPFIEPELRDWPDVLDRARAGTLPNLVTEADFKGQLHEHTTWSDGTASIREMAEAALARGYEYLAITDHSPLVGVANGLNRDRVLAQLAELEALRPEFAARGLTLLSGLEVDICKDGSLDMDDDTLARLDFVVASVHLRYKEDEAAMTARILKALANPHVDLLGHPTGRLMGQREPYPLDIGAVIAAAAAHSKALEINASPERMDLCDTYVQKAKAAGVTIAINCDAHSVRALSNLDWGLCIARRAGLEPADVLNTYSLTALRNWLAAKDRR